MLFTQKNITRLDYLHKNIHVLYSNKFESNIVGSNESFK